MYAGKILGAIFGYLLIGSPIGILLGILIGHYFDSGLQTKWRGFHAAFGNPQGQQQAQRAFFQATFQIMGHVAKADGRVSEREIQLARGIMRRMRLNDGQKKQAIEYFTQGKQVNFDLDLAINELIQNCRHRFLLQMFVEIQFQAAAADGISTNKKRILETICRRLGFSSIFAQRYEHIFGGSGSQRQSYSQRGPFRSHKTTLQEAYEILELKNDASASDIKKAYRKLMSQNHPDKLIAQGLPEEMIKLATDKTQKIQQAYELIREARG